MEHLKYSQLKEIVEWQDRDRSGLRDHGQPSKEAHEMDKREKEAEFTPMERRLIRYELGLYGLSEPK